MQEQNHAFSPRAVAMHWFPLGLSLVFILLIRVPWLPSLSQASFPTSDFSAARTLIRMGPIDVSWALTIHDLTARHADFSRYPFTFGPWGILYHGYHPGTYTAQILASVFLASVFWWAGVSILRRIFADAWVHGPLVCVLGLMVWRGFNPEVYFFSFTALLIADYFFSDDERSRKGTGILLAVAISLLSLVKFSYLMIGMPIVLIVSMDESIRQRRWPRYLPAYLIGLGFFWILGHQSPATFLRFLANSWEVSRGYEESMSHSVAAHWWALESPALYLLVVIVTISFAAWIGTRRHFTLGLVGTLSLLFFYFIVLKVGFVRADDFHALHSLCVAQFTAVLLTLCLWKQCTTRRRKFAAAFVAALAISPIIRYVFLAKSNPASQVLVCLDSIPQSARNAVSWMSGGNPAAKMFELQKGVTRRKNPLPPLRGGVDLYPFNIVVLISNNLDYQPRPALQSYCAYTPMLATLDSEYLRSANAPAWVLFDVDPIEQRYPSLEDGKSWPELMTRYDFIREIATHEYKGGASGYLLLHKSPHVRPYTLNPILRQQAAFRRTVEVPTADGAIWAEIEVKHSLAGSAMAAAYKLPPIWMSVAGPNRSFHKYRLPPGMARAGFLLSPTIRNRAEFAKFAASPDWPGAFQNAQVTRIQIEAGDDTASERFFDGQIGINLYSLEFARGAMN